MRSASLVVGLVLALLVVDATRGAALACDGDGQQITAGADRLDGMIVALLTAEVAGPVAGPTSLGVSFVLRSEDRLVMVVVLDGAQIIDPDGEVIVAEQIRSLSSVRLTGHWAGDNRFEAMRVELHEDGAVGDRPIVDVPVS